VVNDINPTTVNETVAAITASGGQAKAFVTDISQEANVNDLVQFACDKFGGPQVMFNNAGGAFPTPMLKIDATAYRKIMALNIDATYLGSYAALKVMVANGGGSIISTTSGAGLSAVSGLSVYGAAKAAVIALMRSMAVEYGRKGIRANSISLGSMETPALLSWVETLPGGVKAYRDAQPQGRLGRADEVADAAVYLASDNASFINGVCLPVDGAVHSTRWNPHPI
jgi:NAD(P)-dependent dehydrogenase (short-subunit alcohol dehydrogenase family)